MKLIDTYREAVEAHRLDELSTIYTDDALFDAHVPNWRFQVQGRDAIIEQMRTWFPSTGRFAQLVAEPTGEGDLLVRFEWREGDDEIVVREMQLWRLADGRIAEQIAFCAGRWDAALQSQMAAEAPLVRP